MSVHWNEHGARLAKHPPCSICDADEIGSLYDDAWCHCCAWRGPLTALLGHAKGRADAEDLLVAVTEHRDRLASALEQAARDGEEFHRMQEAILDAMKRGAGESPGAHRESYVYGWIGALDDLINRLRSEGLMPS